MFFILEGGEGSGKTTLANKLHRMTGYPIVHRSKPNTEEEKREMWQQYIQAIDEGDNVILDRCWYSEMVYGLIMRDKSYITYSQMYDLEARLEAKGAIIIYCTGTPEALWQRCQARGEEYIKEYATHVAICEEYEDLMVAPHRIPVVRYEVDKNMP